MKGLRQEDLVNQDLITDLRKEFGMTYNDFYMVLTDVDMKLKVQAATVCCLTSRKSNVTRVTQTSGRACMALNTLIQQRGRYFFH